MSRSKFPRTFRTIPILAGVILLTTIQAGMAQNLSPGSPLVEQEPVVVFDLVYGVTGGRQLHLDIAVPRQNKSNKGGQQKFPCVLLIHGGAWRQGNKASLRDQIVGFAQQGYVAATVEYRFCPEHRFPSQLHDVKQAVRFLRTGAERFSIDSQKFAAIGFSAGAHLAMLLGTTDPDDGLEGTEMWSDAEKVASASSKVQVVVAYFGPTDFTQKNIPAQSKSLLHDFIGGTLAEKPDSYRAASPVTHVDVNDAAMLLFQGTRDPLVPYQQAFLMADSMTSASVDGRVELLVGASHGWGGERMDRSVEQTYQFLQTHLK